MIRRTLAVAAVAAMCWADPAAAAVSPRKVREAVARGVQYLRARLSAGDVRAFPHNTGGAALAALALMECGVSASDPAVRAVVEHLRADAYSQNRTYDLSLGILVLDRAGDPADRPLIQLLAVRVMAGQNREGGWAYECLPVAPNEREAHQLRAALAPADNQLTTVPTPAAPADPKTPPVLHPVPAAQLKNLTKSRTPRWSDSGGDNSNTQFATLALWVARRHAVPTEQSLGLIAYRFRESQTPAGWSYTTSGTPKGTMTCAGLLGLAVGRGAAAASDAARPAARKAEREASERATVAGLAALGQFLRAAPATQIDLASQPSNHYFLWSLERVGVALGVETIGGVDWYEWGALPLLSSQAPDGSWPGSYQPEINTPFALLFLQKSNLAADLTAKLPRSQSSMRGKVIDAPPYAEPAPAAEVTPSASVTVAPATPPMNTSSDPARMADDLLQAPADRRAGLLEQMARLPGGEYTDALTQLVTRATGDAQVAARDALTERFSRMTAATLRGKLRDPNAEVRRAAALACGTRQDRSHTPDLIDTLGDTDPAVVRACRTALKHLTGQDFGPFPGSTAAESAAAVADWRRWWRQHGGP